MKCAIPNSRYNFPMTGEGGVGAVERQHEILRVARARRIVRVKDLAAQYGVHEMTIRRDLDLLADAGQIERIHGGARIGGRAGEEIAQGLRAVQNGAAKEAIARAAMSLIAEGDTVAFDASTTSLALARLLGGRDVRAIVTSLDAAETLASLGVPFILAAGAFHPSARSFVGGLVAATLERLNPDKLFFSAKAFAPETGFADPHLPEVEVKTMLVRRAGISIALIDATKFGVRALSRIASLDEVDAIVTDADPSSEDREAIAARDVRLLVAPSPQP